MFDINDDKLGKIVQLAKHGVGGEKANARRLVRQICHEKGISYQDVMYSSDYKEYTIPYRNKDELKIVAQVAYKFAVTTEHPSVNYNKWHKVIIFTTTPSKYIETKYAADVYLKAFRREKRKLLKDLPSAFIIKHDLFSPIPNDEEQKELSDAEREALWRQYRMSENLDDVELQKRLAEKN